MYWKMIAILLALIAFGGVTNAVLAEQCGEGLQSWLWRLEALGACLATIYVCRNKVREGSNG